MAKNTENALINSLAELSIAVDDMKKSFNFFGEKVLEKLDGIDKNLREALDFKVEIKKIRKI